jgi:hypothetical protein
MNNASPQLASTLWLSEIFYGFVPVWYFGYCKGDQQQRVEDHFCSCKGQITNRVLKTSSAIARGITNSVLKTILCAVARGITYSVWKTISIARGIINSVLKTILAVARGEHTACCRPFRLLQGDRQQRVQRPF